MLIGDDEDDVGCSAFRLAGPAGGDLRERFACPQRNGGGEERQQQFATLHASRAHYLPSSNSGSAILANSSAGRSEEQTSELQSIMRISYAVLRLNTKKHIT